MTDFDAESYPAGRPGDVVVRVVAELAIPAALLAERQAQVTDFLIGAGGQLIEFTVVDPESPSGRDYIGRLTPEELERKLAITTGALFEHYSSDEPHKARYYNILRRENIESLRDLLVLGKSGVRDLRNMGQKGIDVVEAVIKAELGRDFEWAASPDAEQAVWLCDSLDQVHSGVVGCHNTSLNLQQVLDLPEDEWVGKLVSTYEVNPHLKARQVYDQAQIYRDRFLAARARLAE